MYQDIDEGEYLIKLLGAAINNTAIDLPPDSLQWDKIYALAAFHNVANTAFYGIQKLPTTGTIPGDILEAFSNAAFKSSAIESLQHFEMRQIFQRFEQNQIFCIPLDGYIIKKYYPRPDMRYISTLILFINKNDKNKIHTILNSLGFSLVRTGDSKSTYLNDSNVALELRTSLIPEKPEYNDFFEEKKKNIVFKKNLKFVGQLKAEDFYIYTMVQLAHLYSSGGAGIRAVLDVWVLLRRVLPMLDKEYINSELSKLDLSLFTFYMEEFSRVWFGGQTKESDNGVYEEMVNHIFENYQTNVLDKVLTDEDSGKKAKSEKQKKEIIFLPLNEMKRAYPILEKMPFMLPIFWVVRLVTVMVKR